MKMISIIIIVKNDFRIRNVLKKLEEIIIPYSYETIVVDASNGSLNEIKSDYSEVSWITYSHPSNKQRTFSEQRNIGFKNAKGEIIVFIDADCVPEKNWISELLKPIIKDKEKIVSGSVKPTDQKQIHKQEEYGKYRDECETMNIAIVKEVFETIGYFDENMEGCEDSDFCIRARNKGYKIRFNKDAIVYHDWGGFIQNIKRSFNGGKDRVSLYKKYPKFTFSFTINNVYTWFYLLYVICLPVAFFYPYYLLIVFIPSIIKLRNPIKEFYNIAFSVGAIGMFIKFALHI